MLYDMTDIMRLITKAVKQTVEGMKPAEVVSGTVQSVAPLRIFVDQKKILDGDFCHLTRAVRDYRTEIEWEEDGLRRTRTVTVKNGLNAGDRVRMLRYNGGQDFLILDRMVDDG